MAADPIVVRPGNGADERSTAQKAIDDAARSMGPVVEPQDHPSSSLAEKLRAGYQRLQNRTREFPIPPADVWGDNLILVARPCEFREGMPPEALVVASTARILARNDEGELEEVSDGWAGLARLMGIPLDDGMTMGRIVKLVLNTDELLAGLVEPLVAFTMGRRSQIEQALGG